MLVLVCRESLKVLLDDEFVDELPTVPHIHRHIPCGGDENQQREAPEETYQKPFTRPAAREQKIQRDDTKWKYKADQTLCKKCDADKEIEGGETGDERPPCRIFLKVVEDKKSGQRRGDGERDDDVKARSVSKSDDANRSRGD